MSRSINLEQNPHSFVVTVLTGCYEDLNENGLFDSKSTATNNEYICFTDDILLRSTNWKVSYLGTVADPKLKSREIKTTSILNMPEYSLFCYKDNNVTLTASPNKIFSQLPEDTDVAFFLHQKRKYLYQEFIACEVYGKDTRERIRSHFLKYLRSSNSVLFESVYCGGLFIAKVNPQTRTFFQNWFDEIRHGSTRDQLSLPMAIQKSGVVIHILEGSILQSSWHFWPEPGLRKDSPQFENCQTKIRRRFRVFIRYVLIAPWYLIKIQKALR